MKKWFYLLLAVLFTPFMCLAQGATAGTYYQKVPKLVPAGDGTYRILEGEYEFMPVDERGYASPVIVGQEKTAQENAALNDEAARWARGENINNDTPKAAPPAQSQTQPVQTVQENTPSKSSSAENRPYLSLGASFARSSFSSKEEYGGYSLDSNFSDTTPFIKAAFGSQFNSHIRTEFFYQYRSKMEDEGTSSGTPWEASATLQDFGLNAFLTLNPNSKARLFIGAGVAATLVSPSYKLAGYDFSDLVDSDLFDKGWFFTPTGFIGLEFPDGSGNIVTDVTLFYSKTFLNRSDTIAGYVEKLEDIDSYGISVNIRFNL